MTIVFIIICLVFSAFFSGLEIAYISANRMKMELDIRKENYNTKFLKSFIKKPKSFIVTMLVGNNIALVLYGILMDKLLSNQLSDFLKLPPILNLLILTIISTFFVIFLAEFIPKAIFKNFANKSLVIFALPAYFFQKLFYIINIIIIFVSSFFIKLFGKNINQEKSIELKDELKYLLSESLTISSEDEDEVDAEVQIFHNALAFSDIKCRACMVPRNEIVSIDINSPIEELKQLFIKTGLSRIVIYKESIDNIVGYVHSFDIFKNPDNIRSIILSVEFLNEVNTAKEALDLLLKKKKNLAVVLEEYGGTSGILTLEDIIEELFGNIEDEHDEDYLIEKLLSKNKYLFSARHEIDYLNQKYNLELPISDSYETIGGLIFNQIGEIPKRGDEIRLYNLNIKIIKASKTKIDVVKISIINE